MSSTESAHPTATEHVPTAIAAVSQPHNDADTKDLVSSPSLPFAEHDAKDVRSYEHDRQRAKNAAYLIKRERSRRHRSASWQAVWKEGKGREAKAEVTKAEVLDAGSLGVRGFGTDGAEREHEQASILWQPVSAGRSPMGDMEVRLTDLVKVAKVRKGKNDFVVIPNLPSVVVLEDSEKDIWDVEEPWEHISGDEEVTDKAPSYANVVVTGGL